MIEFIVGFIIAVGFANAAIDVGTQAYNYAEPTIIETYDSGRDAVKNIIPKATH